MQDTDANKALLEQVNALRWAHSIDLGHGIVTPGKWGKPHPLIWKAFAEIDFTGKKVLDVGCWDGLWSFEAEKRGAAEVFATDDISQRSFKEHPTFLLAHKTLRSRVKYHPDLSVFDVQRLHETFDIVLFCGVYYHLKNPLLALARLRAVMRPGAIIIVEGDVLNGYREVFARFCYRTWHVDDPSNWWIPSIPCLREWIECSFFEIRNEYNSFEPPRSLWPRFRAWLRKSLGMRREIISRYVVTATAAARKDRNYVFPDEDLKECDQNDYEAAP